MPIPDRPVHYGHRLGIEWRAIGGQNGYPGGLYTTSAMNLGPRLGLAWDVFGTGKTAVRAGFGMFKDRLQGNPTMEPTAIRRCPSPPPVLRQPGHVCRQRRRDRAFQHQQPDRGSTSRPQR